MQKAYKEVEEKYKIKAIDAEIDAEWSQEDDDKEKLLPSWRNIRPFLPIIQQIDRRYEGFLASMKDGFSKEINLKEESSCRVENPNFISEDELLAEFKIKFDLVQKDVSTQDEAIQVKPKLYDAVTQIWNLKKSTIETQTLAVYKPTRKNVSTQLNLPPKNSLDQIKPSHSDLNSLRTFSSKIPPITTQNIPSRPNSGKIPSLFDLKINPPEFKDPEVRAKFKKTVKWISDTSRPGCWNCNNSFHVFNACMEEQKKIFCYNCGLLTVTERLPRMSLY